MFRTEHLEGRSVYETDEVACINIFVNNQLTHGVDIYLSQILVSLDTYKFAYYPFSFSHNGENFSEADVDKELNEGVNKYHQSRINLGLKK